METGNVDREKKRSWISWGEEEEPGKEVRKSKQEGRRKARQVCKPG